VDLTGDAYGDLGSNMYAAVWTYYGNDSTYTTPLQSYGTKFAADNWMHKSMGIQLGLTDSLRCQLPTGYDGTGYWTITISAMGYADYTVKFQATTKNIVGAIEEATVDASKLQALVTQAQALKESDYTSATWKDLAAELAESVELLAKTTLTQAEVNEQVTHLSAAIAALAVCDGGSDCTSHSYTDLATTGCWYHTYVDYVLENKLMIGTGDNKFEPEMDLSRAMMVQILYNQAGKPAVTGKSPFSDVTSDRWFYSAVVWAYEQGIAQGYGDGTFGPDDPITREQLATFLWRFDGEPTAAQTTTNFSDASQTSSYAQKALLWASENGIVEGYTDKTIKPLNTATRAETAAMVTRYFQQ
jgi:hypothetical protein